jgi:chromosome segregation ATPase
VVAKNDTVQCLEGQLAESRKRFALAQEELSKLEENVRETNLELSTTRAQQERLENNVRSLHFDVSGIFLKKLFNCSVLMVIMWFAFAHIS